jgi:hypothetical protein
MKLELLSPLWYIFVICAVFLTLFFFSMLRNKTETTKYNIILLLFFVPLAIHFIYPIVEDGDYTTEEFVRCLIPNTFCALSVLIAPFIYICNNKFLKSGMVWFGMVSGLVEVFYPACIGNELSLDMVRFMVVHFFIALPPMMMFFTGLYKPNFADFIRVPIYIILCMSAIMLAQYIGAEIGLLDRGGDFLNIALPNDAEQYAPNNAMWDTMHLRGLLDKVVPEFFQTVQFGEYAGQRKWTPVLWAIVPAFAVCFAVGLAITVLSVVGKIFVRKK